MEYQLYWGKRTISTKDIIQGSTFHNRAEVLKGTEWRVKSTVLVYGQDEKLLAVSKISIFFIFGNGNQRQGWLDSQSAGTMEHKRAFDRHGVNKLKHMQINVKVAGAIITTGKLLLPKSQCLIIVFYQSTFLCNVLQPNYLKIYVNQCSIKPWFCPCKFKERYRRESNLKLEV